MNEVSHDCTRRCSQRSQCLQKKIPNTRRMRRIRTLFWDGDTMYTTTLSDSPNPNTTDLSAALISCGRLKLRKIHSSPHLYLVDDFLTHKELEHFHTMILAAEGRKDFERSFVDEEHSHSDDEIPKTQSIIQDSMTRNSPIPVEEHVANEVMTTRKGFLGIDINPSKKRKRSRQKNYQQRTSKFIHFSRMASKNIANIESRAADLLHLPHHCVEPIQLVKYVPGQYFDVHHDLGVMTLDEAEDAETHQLESLYIRNSHSVHISLPARQNALCPPRRLVTVLVYLNDLPNTCCSCVTKEINIPCSSYCHTPTCYKGFHVTGGSTFFPLLNEGRGLRVMPKQGQALIWCNITEDGLPDKRVIHAGEAITLRRTIDLKEGGVVDESRRVTDSAWVDSSIFPIKYALNIWVCEE